MRQSKRRGSRRPRRSAWGSLAAVARPWSHTVYRTAWLLIAVLLSLGLLSLFWPQYIQYRNYSRRIKELEQTISREQAIIKNLQLKQQRLKTDPEFLRRVAHQMGLADEDEVIFRFVGPQTNRTPGETER